MIRQAFGEESMSHTWKVQTHGDRKKGETDEEQSEEHARHFFILKGLFTKNSAWQAKQSIPHTAVT
jgi:hypothetical protein